MSMLTINLGKGGFHVIDGHKTDHVEFRDAQLPVMRYEFNRDAHMSKLPPIADVYDVLMNGDFAPERVLAKLIQRYLPVRLFRVGHFSRMPIVLGFIGQRGAGKTVGAVGTAVLDWLLRSEPVWSNVDISVRVVYKELEHIFRSQPLDRLDLLDLTAGYKGGVVLVDEVNMEGAEATRSMAGANLQFANVLQQVRKRQLSVIWTCQGWHWIDNRLRWQSDWVINCRDAFLGGDYDSHAIGEKSAWRVYDLSGLSGKFDADFEMSHRWLNDYVVWEGAFRSKTFWDAYNTEQLQGQQDYIGEYKRAKKYELVELRSGLTKERNMPYTVYAKQLHDSGTLFIDALEVWAANGAVGNRGVQTALGMALKPYFDKRRGGDGEYFYVRRDVPLSEMLAN